MLVVDRKSEWPNKTRAENRAPGRAREGTEGREKGRDVMVRWWKDLTH